jgi:regulator of protease activity HflC (stomatin/prohibitin superfamily)
VAALVATGEWWLSLIVGLAVTSLMLALRAAIVVVPERKAAVLFNQLKGYTGLRRSGLAFVLPGWERVGFYLDLGPKTAQFTIPDIHTRDQVPVAISLMLFYHVDPWRIQPALRPQLIHDLELSGPNIIQNQVEHLLRGMVGHQDIAALLQPETRVHLEECLTRELPGRVEWLGIAISGHVMLRHITLPESLQGEINRAQQTRIYARTRADALNALREVLDTQPDQAWEAVIELEAVDAMGRNGAPIFFPYSTGWNGGASESREDGNKKGSAEEQNPT